MERTISMSKRASDSITPAPKQQRVGDHTPVTSARPHGRVVLNVGGAKFESSKTTLEVASSYFTALLARWDENTDEPLFIDGDADAFQPLLSYMRFGTLTMPAHDEGLCTRVLLQAEYLGMDSLLAEVKAKAYANLHPATHQDEARPLADAFDEEVGSLAAAIRSKVLPSRYFAPAPEPRPEPPKRTIKALLPATPGYRALFTAGNFDHGEARDGEYNADEAACESLHIVSWALVEYHDGTQTVDAVVQRDIGDTRHSAAIPREDAHALSGSHIHLASEYRGALYAEWSSRDALHWMVIPPQAPGQMVPIPPGAVRGRWAQPAFTPADEGKHVTISDTTVTVDGDVRMVVWGADGAPQNITNAEITDVRPWAEFDSAVTVVGLPGIQEFAIPPIAGVESCEVGLAFAAMDASSPDDTGAVATAFYMPIASHGPGEPSTTQLSNAKGVTFGKLEFECFVGAMVDAKSS